MKDIFMILTSDVDMTGHSDKEVLWFAFVC